MSDDGLSFLASRGRANANALTMLDQLGRQAPAPDSTPASVPTAALTMESAPAVPASRPLHRVMLSWGPDPGSLMIGLETAPDWDIEESWCVSRDAAREFLPILSALTKVKDLTGEMRRVLGPQAVPNHAEDAPARPQSARKQAPRTTSNGRGSGAHRAPRTAVGERAVADGPPGPGQDGALVQRAAASVQEAVQ